MAKTSVHYRGDPWSMFGLISFWFALQGEHPFFSGDLRLDPFKIELSVKTDPDSIEQMKEWLRSVLQHRWNELFWRSPTAKIFDRPLTYEDGFVDINDKIELNAGMRKSAKEDHKRTLNEIEAVAKARDNFIGVGGSKGDAGALKASIAETVEYFVDQLIERTGRQTCDICGRQCPKRWPARQYLNPFINKHHNTKVRDAHVADSGYFQICPECRMICLFATLDRNVPFVRKGNNRSVIIPDIKDLKLLRDVYIRLRQNLVDLRADDALSIWTNLRTHWANDTHSLTVALLHNIMFRFSDSNGGNWTWDPAAANIEKIATARWYVLPFTKGKNVNFGAIRSIKPKHNAYRLIEELSLSDGRTFYPVPDLLAHIREVNRGSFSVGLLSKAVATCDSRILTNGLRFLCSEYIKGSDKAKVGIFPQKGRPHAVLCLEPFVNHFLEVTN